MIRPVNRIGRFGALAACAILSANVAFGQTTPAEQNPQQNPQQNQPERQDQPEQQKEAEQQNEAERQNESERRNDAERRKEAGEKSSHTGEFAEATESKLFMTVDGEKRHSHKVNDETKVTLNGEQAELKDLKSGDDIRVTTNEDNVALKIEATRGRDAARERDERDPTPGQSDRQDPRDQRDPSDRRQAQDRDAGDRGESRIRLGVRVQESPTTGVYVTDVMPNSPAARAGIQRGEYILSIDGRRISSPQNFRSELTGLEAGKSAKVVLWRNRTQRTLDVSFPEERTAGFRGAQTRPEGRAEERRPSSWIGVRVAQAQDDQSGVRVVGVYPSGPASRAGLRSGDRLIRINDRRVNSPKDVITIIGETKPASQAELVVMRGEREQKLTATLADRNDYFVGDPVPQERRDGETAQRGDEGEGDFDSSHGIPEHAMMLEQHRRIAEQNQRIEEMLLDLRDEVEELRNQLQTQNNGARPNDRQPNDRQPNDRKQNDRQQNDRQPIDREQPDAPKPQND